MLQAIHGGAVDPEGASDLGDGLTGIKPLDRLTTLVLAELRRPPELHAPRLGALTTLAGARLDQRALELGKPAENIVSMSVP